MSDNITLISYAGRAKPTYYETPMSADIGAGIRLEVLCWLSLIKGKIAEDMLTY